MKNNMVSSKLRKEYQITASVVLFKNNRLSLLKTVNSFLNTEMKVRLFLIDNSPSNDLIDFSNDSRVVYIFNDKNLGFGSGHNVAISKALSTSEYHLVLNPDVYFEEGTLEEIYAYMEENSDIGQLMPKVLYPDGKLQKLCKLLPTPLNLIFRRFIPFPKLLESLNAKYEMKFINYDMNMDVPSLSGCFMFIRSSILETTGGFDEIFFMYVEDVDLCRRIGNISRTVYFPAVSITHSFEKGSYKNMRLLIYHTISAIKYFNKWGWLYDRRRDNLNNATTSFVESEKGIVNQIV